MNDKHLEVSNWLQKTFGGDVIPQYEINARTVDILHDLMLKNERQDTCAALIQEDLQQKAEEYNAEAERLSFTLEKLGLGPGALSQSGTASLRSLASIGLLLDVRDATETSLLLALSENIQQMLRLRDARRLEQRLTSQLLAKNKSAILRCNTLKKALHGLDEQAAFEGPELKKKAKQAGFLQTKAREYKKHIQELQRELAASGADPSIYHGTLLQKAEELKQLREKLQPKKAKLDSYHKLPPDLSLAKVKVEELKRELTGLEEELAKHINLMHM